MVTYRPAQKPLATRLIQNTTLQVLTLGVLVAGVAVYVRDQNRAANFASAQRDQQIANQFVQTDSLKTESETAREAANASAQQQQVESAARVREAAEADAVASKEANEVQATNLASSAAPSSAQTPAPAAQQAVAAGIPAAGAVSAPGAAGELAKSVSIYFAEVPRSQMNELLGGSRQNGGDGISNFGVIREAQKKFALVRAFRKIDVSTDQAIRMNQPNITFQGTHDIASGQNFGINIQAVPVASDENGIRFQIDANRVLRDPNSGVEVFNFPLPDSFVVPKRGAFILTGALPHRPPLEGDAQIYRNSNLLRSMTGAQFRQGLTDVALIIEAK